jgi:hypothetical protein
MTESTDHTREILRSLSARYAAGVDRRDLGLFLGVFHPDASLVTYPPSAAGASSGHRMQGHDEIGQVIARIAVYRRTFHHIGQGLYDVGDATATGEVYCVAHHISSKGGPWQERTMYIRYEDEYRGGGGDWKIASRAVRVDWTEDRTVADLTMTTE